MLLTWFYFCLQLYRLECGFQRLVCKNKIREGVRLIINCSEIMIHESIYLSE